MELRCYSAGVGGADAGAPLVGDLLSAATLQRALAATDGNFPVTLPLDGSEPTDWSGWQLIPFRSEDVLLLELEPCGQPGDITVAEVQQWQSSFSHRLRAARSSTAVLKEACRLLHEWLGLDRNCYYQLSYRGGPGRITAECRQGRLESLEHLNFRSEDFPPEAYRKLGEEPVLCYGAARVPTRPVLGDIMPFLDLIRYRVNCRLLYAAATEFIETTNTRTHLSVAIRVGGDLHGVLIGHDPGMNRFDQQHRNLLRLPRPAGGSQP